MFKSLFESVTAFFKAIICCALLIAAAAGAVTLAYVVIMTCIRTGESLWHHFFSQPWP